MPRYDIYWCREDERNALLSEVQTCSCKNIQALTDWEISEKRRRKIWYFPYYIYWKRIHRHLPFPSDVNYWYDRKGQVSFHVGCNQTTLSATFLCIVFNFIIAIFPSPILMGQLIFYWELNKFFEIYYLILCDVGTKE